MSQKCCQIYKQKLSNFIGVSATKAGKSQEISGMGPLIGLRPKTFYMHKVLIVLYGIIIKNLSISFIFMYMFCW